MRTKRLRSSFSRLFGPFAVVAACPFVIGPTNATAGCPPDTSNVVLWEQGPSISYIEVNPSDGGYLDVTAWGDRIFGFDLYNMAIFFAKDGRSVTVGAQVNAFSYKAKYKLPDDPAFKGVMLVCEDDGLMCPIEDVGSRTAHPVSSGNPVFPMIYWLDR